MDRLFTMRPSSLPVQKCEGTVVIVPAKLSICDAHIGGQRHYLIWTHRSPDNYAVNLTEAKLDFDENVRPYIDILESAKRNEREVAEDNLIEAVITFLGNHPCTIQEAWL